MCETVWGTDKKYLKISHVKTKTTIITRCVIDIENLPNSI